MGFNFDEIFDFIKDLLPIIIGLGIFSSAGTGARKKLEETQKKIEETKLNNKGESTAYRNKVPASQNKRKVVSQSVYKENKKDRREQTEQLINLKNKPLKESQNAIHRDLVRQESKNIIKEKFQKTENIKPDYEDKQDFGGEELIRAIIFSEIISKPKALRR